MQIKKNVRRTGSKYVRDPGISNLEVEVSVRKFLTNFARTSKFTANNIHQATRNKN